MHLEEHFKDYFTCFDHLIQSHIDPWRSTHDLKCQGGITITITITCLNIATFITGVLTLALIF